MNLKNFLQFIQESSEPRVEWDGAKLWFDKDTDFRELLGQGIWQFRTNELTEEEVFKLVKRLEQDLQVEAQPISLVPTGPVAQPRLTLYLSLDKWVLAEEVEDWSDRITDHLRKYADLFKSNAGGVDQILHRGGRDLTADQLVQLLTWAEDRGLSPNYLKDITEQIKKHPNWPEDITDWALGDW
jgi:hypothetical protein